MPLRKDVLTLNGTLFANRVFIEIIKLKRSSLGGPSFNTTSVFIKGEIFITEIDEKIKAENRMMYPCQKPQRLPANHQELGDRNETEFPSGVSEGANTLLISWILDFSLPRNQGRNKLLLFKPPSSWCFVMAAPGNRYTRKLNYGAVDRHHHTCS